MSDGELHKLKREADFIRAQMQARYAVPARDKLRLAALDAQIAFLERGAEIENVPVPTAGGYRRHDER